MKVSAVKSHCEQQLKANKKQEARQKNTYHILSADKKANNLFCRFLPLSGRRLRDFA